MTVEYGFRVTYPGASIVTHAAPEDAARAAVDRINADHSPASAELVRREVGAWRADEPGGCLTCGHADPHHVRRGECPQCGCDAPVWPADRVPPAGFASPGMLVALGDGGHICHPPSALNADAHAVVCPTGEHAGGWQHMGGPHKMCRECR